MLKHGLIMKKQITLAYSTCPNDTFIFFALANNLIKSSITFSIYLKDVEALNQDAKASLYDVSKLSFAAIGYMLDKYALLNTGSALGRGCGPLIVSREGFSIEGLKNSKIAVPGLLTTANMLLSLYLNKKPLSFPMTFDKIMPSVQNGKFDYGVIIHEGRFTYKDYNLICLIDLGKWWEDLTNLPIPLGGIAIRRDKIEYAELINNAIFDSIEFSNNNKNAANKYIKKYAMEMSDNVISEHIKLYVNNYTLNIGQKGKEAINTFYKYAYDAGLIPQPTKNIFA